ncbi:MAG: AMP-binding protein [Actinomycetota bacterium]
MAVPARPIAAGLVEWATRAPDRIAVRDDDGALTFAELDALAGTVARELHEATADVGATGVVPVLLGHDRWSVATLHGVVRAGRAFAPLDADAPPAALEELFERLGRPACAVVAGPPGRNRLPDRVTVVETSRCPADPVGPVGGPPHDPLLVVFTSGSSGRTKGVVHDAATFDAVLAGFAERSPVGPDEHVAHLLPVHWIAGLVRALLPGLGSSIVLTSPTDQSADTLVALLAAERITVLPAAPSVLARLAWAASGHRRLETVRSVRTFGEALDWLHVVAIRGLVAPDAVITTEYGATESCWSVFEGTVGPDVPIGVGTVPLGLPPVVDRVMLEPVDVGPTGLHEVVVRGPVAVGYLDDPAATAERFGVDADGTRWWRSRDLVRVAPDGTIHPSGRRDDLVKVGAVFVSTADVERELASVPGVVEAAVVPVPGAERTRLIAHVEVDPAAGLTSTGLRAQMQERLAPVSVPALIVRHAAMPRTGTGKVDRARLGDAPVAAWRELPPRPVRSALEFRVLDQVRRIVGIDDVGPDDDLTTVGLDSLGVVELCAAIAELGLGTLDPADVVAAGSVAEICTRFRAVTTTPRSTAVLWNADGANVPIVALPGGGGTAVGLLPLAVALGPERPLLVVEPRGLHRRGHPDRTVARFAAHVCAEIEAHLGPDDPRVLVGYSASGPIAYEAARRQHAAGRRVHVVLLDTAPGLRGLDAPAGAPPTVRSASGATLPGALARSVRYRVRHLSRVLRRWRAQRFPGPPRFDDDRYRVFLEIMMRAGRKYVPPSVDFPVTLLQIADHEYEPRCRATVADLTVHRVGGDHRTMMAPPHIAEIAAIVAGIADVHLQGPPHVLRLRSPG